jgi:hypothetical protein
MYDVFVWLKEKQAEKLIQGLEVSEEEKNQNN